MENLNKLIDDLQLAIRLSDQAERAMRRHVPGSDEGARLAALVRAADKRAAELRREIANHPDRDPDGGPRRN